MRPFFGSGLALRLEGVTFGYAAQPALFEGFNWSVNVGDSWSILGPSGCGKTTLLYLLSGLRKATGGCVYVGGEPVRAPRRDVALMLQDYGLLPWMTARANIEVGLAISGATASERRRISGMWLERLGISAVAHHYMHQLSGGQRQRVALGRALALEPSVLLLDEPFSSVDEITRERLQTMLWELQAELNITLVLVTHSVEEALLLGRDVMILDRARPLRDGLRVSTEWPGMPLRTDPRFQDLCARLRARLMPCD